MRLRIFYRVVENSPNFISACRAFAMKQVASFRNVCSTSKKKNRAAMEARLGSRQAASNSTLHENALPKPLPGIARLVLCSEKYFSHSVIPGRDTHA